MIDQNDAQIELFIESKGAPIFDYDGLRFCVERDGITEYNQNFKPVKFDEEDWMKMDYHFIRMMSSHNWEYIVKKFLVAIVNEEGVVTIV